MGSERIFLNALNGIFGRKNTELPPRFRARIKHSVNENAAGDTLKTRLEKETIPKKTSLLTYPSSENSLEEESQNNSSVLSSNTFAPDEMNSWSYLSPVSSQHHYIPAPSNPHPQFVLEPSPSAVFGFCPWGLPGEEDDSFIPPPVPSEEPETKMSLSLSSTSSDEGERSPNLQISEQMSMSMRCSDWDIHETCSHSSDDHEYDPHDGNLNRNLSSTTGFIDTHCHLDFLFKRARHMGSHAMYCKIMDDTYPSNYEGCVTNFCDPDTFVQTSFWQRIIQEQGVWAAFGCHPHHAERYTEEIDEALIQALTHSRVVALGEIGLDYSNRNNCDRNQQHKVFKRQLSLAVKLNLPLVIHSRDSDEDCFKIMKEIVPDNHRIHLHCFRNSWSMARMWLDHFPHLFIGITNCVTYPSAKRVHEVVKNLPLNRLLLETDAPYFLPAALPKSMKWSHPGMAIHVAAQVSTLKGNTTLEEVLHIVRQNTKTMYGI